jgi:hypothetical protein
MNTTTQFSLLGVLFVLLAWVTFSVTKTAARKKRSPLGIPDGAQTVRFIVCGLFVVVACASFWWSADGVFSGKILENNYTRFISSHAFTVYRADEPDRFWKVVCENCFFGLLFLYLVVAEITLAVKRSKHVKPKPSA